MTTSANIAPQTDRIDKQVHVNAPRSRVWRAIADAEESCTWFRLKLDGTFAPGATVHGTSSLDQPEAIAQAMLAFRLHPLPKTRDHSV